MNEVIERERKAGADCTPSPIPLNGLTVQIPTVDLEDVERQLLMAVSLFDSILLDVPTTENVDEVNRFVDSVYCARDFLDLIRYGVSCGVVKNVMDGKPFRETDAAAK